MCRTMQDSNFGLLDTGGSNHQASGKYYTHPLRFNLFADAQVVVNVDVSFILFPFCQVIFKLLNYNGMQMKIKSHIFSVIFGAHLVMFTSGTALLHQI